MTRLKNFLLGILRKMSQSRRSKLQNTARNEYYIIAKSRRLCRDLQRILRVKNWRRSENFNEIGILRICGVTARSHIRLPTSTFTRYVAISGYSSSMGVSQAYHHFPLPSSSPYPGLPGH